MIKVMTQLGYGWEIIPLSAAFPQSDGEKGDTGGGSTE